jgi:hypothetical protein
MYEMDMGGDSSVVRSSPFSAPFSISLRTEENGRKWNLKRSQKIATVTASAL